MLYTGHELGWRKGAELGKELGFYMGCSLVWARLQQQSAAEPAEAQHTDEPTGAAAQEPAEGGRRTQAITRLQGAVEGVRVNATHAALHDELAAARTAFRRAARLLAPRAQLSSPTAGSSALSF